MACQEFRKEVDAVYPEPMSMLHRGTLASLAIESTSSASRRLHSRRLDNAAMPGRYRTQPVTFHEIKVTTKHSNCDSILIIANMRDPTGNQSRLAVVNPTNSVVISSLQLAPSIAH